MSYTSGFTAVSGAVFTASQYNTNVRDNFTAVWVYTTAGDMAYATSATAATRIALGAANTILRSTGSTPAWNSIATMFQLAALVAAQAAGDLFYAASATTIARLAKGTAYQILRMNAGATAPEWGSAFYANVSRVTNQSISNASATLVSFDTENYDTGTFWTAGSPTLFTVPSNMTGPFTVSAWVEFANNATGYRYISMQDGGGVVLAAEKANAVNGDTTALSITSSAIYMVPGSTIKIYVYQNSGGALNVTGNMTLTFLGAG